MDDLNASAEVSQGVRGRLLCLVITVSLIAIATVIGTAVLVMNRLGHEDLQEISLQIVKTPPRNITTEVPTNDYNNETQLEELIPWIDKALVTHEAGAKRESSIPFNDIALLSGELYADKLLPKIVGVRFWFDNFYIIKGITLIYQDKEEDFLQTGFRIGKGGPGSSTYMMADDEYIVKAQGWRQGSNKLTIIEFVTNKGAIAAYYPSFWYSNPGRTLEPNWSIEVPQDSGDDRYAVIGLTGFFDSDHLNEISLQYINLKEYTEHQVKTFLEADKRGSRDVG